MNVSYYRDSKNNYMALLIPKNYSKDGIEFFTDDNAYMQTAYMGHPSGHIIEPHYHNIVSRTIDYTCETLVLRQGVLAVDLYENQKVIHSFIMKSGDILTLFSGGHGFRVIEDVEMVEIKQGPYIGPEDKTRF